MKTAGVGPEDRGSSGRRSGVRVDGWGSLSPAAPPFFLPQLISFFPPPPPLLLLSLLGESRSNSSSAPLTYLSSAHFRHPLTIPSAGEEDGGAEIGIPRNKWSLLPAGGGEGCCCCSLLRRRRVLGRDGKGCGCGSFLRCAAPLRPHENIDRRLKESLLPHR